MAVKILLHSIYERLLFETGLDYQWRTMRREPLKSKFGCDRCKLRRKKCDEQRPVCDTCARLNLICKYSTNPLAQELWQEQTLGDPSGDSSSLDSLTIKRVPLSSRQNLRFCPRGYTGYLPFDDQGQFSLATQIARLYSPLIAPTASYELHDTSILTTVALQCAPTRDALAGFAAYVLYSADRSRPKLKREALRLYQRGVSGLTAALQSNQAMSTDMELLVAITFLGLTEVGISLIPVNYSL